MSTTQIPPANPAPSTPPARPPEGGDLYDARYWESAYREIVEAPALIIKLQDDLSQARRREAFWISVCVHLVVVLLLVELAETGRVHASTSGGGRKPRVEPEGPHLSRIAS